MRITDVDVGIADYPRASAYGPRQLTDWELVWVISGSAHWTRLDELIALPVGDLLLLSPGAQDRFEWSGQSRSRHGWIHFRLLSPPPELHDGQPARIKRMTDQDPTAALCHYALSLGSGTDRRLAAVVSLLVEIVLAPTVSVAVRPSDLLAAATAAVGERFRRLGPGRVDLMELARAVGISPRQLSRVLSAELGVSPGRAFEAVRLARVATLLARSDLTVSAIAEACGYESPFHLSRRFRTHYGCPPTAYRELPHGDQRERDPFRGTPIETVIRLVDAAERP